MPGISRSLRPARRVRHLPLLLLVPVLAHAQAPPLTRISPSPEENGYFGYAVAGVPDANGDGQGDFLVGTLFEDGGVPGAGRAWLYTSSGLREVQSPTPEDQGWFGVSVAGVEDVSGDGRGDFLVGAENENGGATDAGRVHLFNGATGALLRTLASPNPEVVGRFGRSVAGVPDADGDGRPDVLVGAYLEDGGAESAGRAYLFSGATGALLQTLQSSNAGAFDYGYFGSSVAGVEDVDGDGRGDLLVGAYQEDVEPELGDAGRVYLFSGATGALLRTLVSPNAERSGIFGFRVSGVPDATGDGRGDLLIGAPGEDGGAEGAGRAYLFSGATGTLLRAFASPNPEPFGGFGSSVAGLPTSGSDGRGLLIGAWVEDGGAENAGRAYFFEDNGTLLRTLASPNPERHGSFGRAVAGVPAADGDGYSELLVGAYNEDGGATQAGRAYLFASGSGIGVSASGSPAAIPPGGVVRVTTTTSSYTGQPAPLDLWITAARASGGPPLLTRLLGALTLSPGAHLTQSFNLRAPRNTPPDVFSVRTYVGTFPNTVLATDFFRVQVEAGHLVGAPGPAAEPFVLESVVGDGLAPAPDSPSQAASSPTPSGVASPNPFARRTALRFSLSAPSAVRLAVYDVLGREVAVLVDGEQAAGAHTAVFDAQGLASGAYVWRLTTGSAVQTGRITMLE